MAATMKNEPHIDDALETLIAKISPTSGPSADDLAANGETKIEGKLVDLKSWISFFTYDVLGEAMFSKRFGFLVEGRDIGNSISITFKLALYVTLAAYAQWVHWLFLGSPILRWIDFQPSLHIFDRATDAIKERKANPEMAHADMMGQWMAQLQKHPERMEEKEILCAVLGGLSAGGETISGTLQVFFNMLLRHPEHYRRLTDELLEAQAKGKLSKIVTYAEAQTLPFLQACLKEAIRIYPVVSWNLPRDVPRAGLTVAGKFFEPGTVLSVNPFVIHHNPEIFGDDASEYNPYRWLNAEKGKHLDGYILTVSPFSKTLPFFINSMSQTNILQFGYGSRLCVGKSLALLELNKFTATLVRDFEMRLPDPSRKWRSHSLFVTVFPDWSCYMTPRRHGTSEYRNAREEKRI
ncbi:hypothetical protein MMC25_000269 [Agyrium rufum]|nr:hypothetical protein [Agyrium rufum]